MKIWNSDSIEDLVELLSVASSRKSISIDENYKDSARTVIDYHNLYNIDNEYRIQEGIKTKYLLKCEKLELTMLT